MQDVDIWNKGWTDKFIAMGVGGFPLLSRCLYNLMSTDRSGMLSASFAP